MRARYVIDPLTLVTEDAILFHSVLWGRGGERYTVGYAYPTAANLGISHTIAIGSKVDFRISLKSGVAVINGIDTTTQWAITVAPNTPVTGI